MRNDNGYKCTIDLEFSDLDLDASPENPAIGTIEIQLSENVPHPVIVGFKNINKPSANADHVDFDNWVQRVESIDDHPIIFQFVVSATNDQGGKWCFYNTSNWDVNSDKAVVDDKEFVAHHVGIPSAQKIRIIHSILSGEASEELIYDIERLYEGGVDESISKFSDDLKMYVGFENKLKVQSFLIQNNRLHRNKYQTINKVAKQITEEEFQYRISNREDLNEYISLVNSDSEFPNVTFEEVWDEVKARCSKSELNEIRDELSIN